MIYVDCDASYSGALGLAGIAYVSTALGNRRQVVRCGCPTEAEIRAVLMATADHRGHRELTLRSDNLSAAKPQNGSSSQRNALRATRKRLLQELEAEPTWTLKWLARSSNGVAHGLARGARRAAERAFA